MSSSSRWIDPSILHNHFHNCGRNMLHLIYIPNAYNLYQANEMPSGWPLGLENMNMRFRVMERLQAASEDPNYFGVHSTSISSFASSDLDTEVILFRPLLLFFNHYYSRTLKGLPSISLNLQSTRSFFQDHSITLGRLIGISPGEGDLYFTNSVHHHEEHDRASMMSARSLPSKRRKTREPRGICLPLILCVLVKISRSRNRTRHWSSHFSEED